MPARLTNQPGGHTLFMALLHGSLPHRPALLFLWKMKSIHPRAPAHMFFDDFCTGDTGELRTAALLCELEQYLAELSSFNINDMMKRAISTARIDMTADEYRQFCERHLKNLHLRISDDGEVSLGIAK